MSRIWLRLAASLLLGVGVVASANTSLVNLQQRLNGFSTMKANFTQALYAGKKTPEQTSKGTMALQRPGRFIWKTTEPNQQTLIANGKTMWVYDEDLEQATKTHLASDNANSPAVFLTGDVSRIPERFIVQQRGDHFTLSAKNKDDMFQKITLDFKGDALAGMAVTTRLEQTSRFTFSKVRLNTPFARNTFIFHPPTGVDVLENR